MYKEFERVSSEFGLDFKGLNPNSGFYELESKGGKTRDILEALFREPNFWCDYLISISATHIVGPPEKVGVHYHLASIPNGLQVHVFEEKQVESMGALVEFDSVCNLWRTAEWHEREAAELFGIRFTGHPDPRKLLLPANWVGFPMRKNYVEQSEYHGIKVKF